MCVGPAVSASADMIIENAPQVTNWQAGSYICQPYKRRDPRDYGLARQNRGMKRTMIGKISKRPIIMSTVNNNLAWGLKWV